MRLFSKVFHVNVTTNDVKDYLLSHKAELKALGVYLLIALIMFWQVTININSYVVNGHGDVYQTLFNLWWVPYSLFVLHQSPYFSHLLFYPVGANLVTQTLTPLAGIFSAPFQLISSALAYNVLFFSSFALSGLFMFVLANYFVKNKYAAFLAGLIYAFSPMHISQAYGHLDWTIIEWIPLFLFFYVKTLDLHKKRYALLAAISFVLLSFMGDLQQGIMVFVAALIFTVLYWLFYTPESGRHPKVAEHRTLGKIHFLSMNSISKGSLQGIVYVLVFTFVLSLPFIIGIVPGLSQSTFQTAQLDTSIVQKMLWSNNVASFFLPSYYNGIFHNMSLSYLQPVYGLTYQGTSFQTDIGEKVAYIGYTVLLLALIAIYYDYKQNRLKHTFIWIIFFIIFAWLSLGPYVQFYTTVTGIPTLYSIYNAIPILNIIREPGRFDLIATICLGVLAAFGFDHLTKDKDRKTQYQYLAVVSILILIEYNGMPLSGAFASTLITPTQIPKAYTDIGNLTGNFTVLILPALPNASDTPAQYTGLATYYTSATKKPLIGGYTSRENNTQQLTVSSIPLVDSALYLEEGYGLVYPSPITENYSNVTTFFLATYNTAFISVQLNAFNVTADSLLLSYLTAIYGQAAYRSNDTFVFETQKAVQKAGSTIIAYDIGSWVSGYNFCNPYGPCDQNISSMWWGNNTRSIVLYSPHDENINMKMIGISPINGTPVGIYLNGNPVTQIALSGAQRRYSINMTVPQGVNEVTFYARNNTLAPQAQALYGLKNITFTH